MMGRLVSITRPEDEVDGARDLLRTCGLIEAKAAELYRYFGELFRADSELTLLWEKTASEEDNHRYQFELAARTESSELTATVDKSVADRLLAAVSDLLDRLRRNPPNAVQALELAIQMEERMTGFHMDSAVAFKNKASGSLYRAMMASDRDHVQTLRTGLAALKARR